MAVKSKEEIMNTIKSMYSDDTSDEAIAFIEDISDTLSDYETRLQDDTDWKQKYETNDAEWKKKYKDRFFNTSVEDEEEEEEEEKPIPKTFEDLFKTI